MTGCDTTGRVELRSGLHERKLRVFVSSTFRDHKLEREHLVKYVFPELRRLCELRGVVWSEIDLRWGVTDEQKAEGEVLPVCLAEIERCRPYFIGLLGERYGWVPERVGADLIAMEPWIADFGRREDFDARGSHHRASGWPNTVVRTDSPIRRVTRR